MLLVAGGYWAAAKGAEVLWLTGQAAAFWLATGVGIAVLYLGGWRWWPGVLLGNLLSRVFVLPLWVVLVSTAVEVVMTLAAVLILQRLVGWRAAMDRLDQVGAVLVAVAVNAAVTATGAMLVGLAEGFIETSVMGVFWRSWWLGSLAGGLVVVPLALAWAHTRVSAWRGRRVVEAALTLAAVIGLSLLAFSADQPFTYIVFPALIWAGLRLGPPGATLAVAVAAVIAVVATARQLGPFVEHSPTDSALNLQLYMVLAALTTGAWRRSSASAGGPPWSWPSPSVARVSVPPWSDSASPVTCTTRSPSRCSRRRCMSAAPSSSWSSSSWIPLARWGRSWARSAS